MRRFALGLGVVLAVAATMPVEAMQKRSAAAKAAFQRENPCPATGKPRGSCPGYIIDHVVPLCAGGEDAPTNMQWQPLAESLAKDTLEREQCRHLRHQRAEGAQLPPQ